MTYIDCFQKVCELFYLLRRLSFEKVDKKLTKPRREAIIKLEAPLSTTIAKDVGYVTVCTSHIVGQL